jgi:hypothetical protein
MLVTLLEGKVRRSSTIGELGVEADSRADAEFFRLNFCLSAAKVASNPTMLKLALRLLLVVGEEVGLFSLKTGGNSVAAKVFFAATNDDEAVLRIGTSSRPGA